MASQNTLTGRLRNIIVIESPVDGVDPSGAPITTYDFYIRRYASIVPLNGSEFFASQQLNVNVNVRFRLRYDKSVALITAKYRIKWNENIYDIHAVINKMEHNKEIIIMCEETQ